MEQVTLKGYIVGFVSSLYLTLTAYFVVSRHRFSGTTLLLIITGLALIQFLVQLLYFLHLGRETQPRWKLVTFYFMLGTVAILVFGSLWIMTNLDYHHGHAANESDGYIIHDEGIQPSAR
jgi:cytochrome o ubiquinol oxidase operon protein cyoD